MTTDGQVGDLTPKFTAGGKVVYELGTVSDTDLITLRLGVNGDEQGVDGGTELEITFSNDAKNAREVVHMVWDVANLQYEVVNAVASAWIQANDGLNMWVDGFISSNVRIDLPLLTDRYGLNGSPHATLQRASAGTVIDYLGNVLDILPNEGAFEGARRVDWADGQDYGAGALGIQYFDTMPDGSTPLTTMKRLAVWEASTNEVINSDIENWAPQGSATVSGETITFSALSSDSMQQGSPATASQVYTISAIVKVVSGTKDFRFRLWDNTSGSQYSADITATTTPTLRSWTATTGSPVSTVVHDIYNDTAGTAGDLIIVGGVNVEKLPYATPLIRTNGASASRVADGVQTVPVENLLNDFVIDGVFNSGINGTNIETLIDVFNTSLTESITVRVSTAGVPEVVKRVGGVNGAVLQGVAGVPDQSYKWAVAVSTTRLALFIDDVKVDESLTQTADFSQALTKFNLGRNRFDGQYLNGNIGDGRLRLGDLTDGEVIS